MKSIILLTFTLNILFATCSTEEIKKSDRLYAEANQATSSQKQIELLQSSLNSCYAPEIEASLFILQAQESNDTTQKIAFYKESLVSISNFQDKNLLFENQCKINKILSTLYKNIDDEVSAIYLNKALAMCGSGSKRDYRWGYLIGVFFILFFLWEVWGIFDHSKEKRASQPIE